MKYILIIVLLNGVYSLPWQQLMVVINDKLLYGYCYLWWQGKYRGRSMCSQKHLLNDQKKKSVLDLNIFTILLML